MGSSSHLQTGGSQMHTPPESSHSLRLLRLRDTIPKTSELVSVVQIHRISLPEDRTESNFTGTEKSKLTLASESLQSLAGTEILSTIFIGGAEERFNVTYGDEGRNTTARTRCNLGTILLCQLLARCEDSGTRRQHIVYP